MSLLDQLIDAMDAADKYSQEDIDGEGSARRVNLTLAHGCLIAVVTRGDHKAERRISIDQLDLAAWNATARSIVDDAVKAL